MRIISTFHDYYDGVQKVSFNSDIMYKREPVEYTKKNIPKEYYSPISYIDAYDSFKTGVIGFCGTLFPVVSWVDFHNPKDLTITPTYVMYSMDDVDVVVARTRKNKVYAAFQKSYQYRGLHTFFKEDPARFASIFERYSCPVFLFENAREPTLTINPPLYPYEFYRIRDPYTAFQEIGRFLSNIAAPEKKIPFISDEMKVATHGFDQYSFRKEKSQ